MALFPFFVNIEGKEGLVIGTGKHAQEKVKRLEPYGPKLRIIPEGEFSEKDLESVPAFVVAAGDDAEENHRIANLCRDKRILVNVVDDQEYCDFIFPSLIREGNLSIGICTGGASPATGVLLKQRFQEEIPSNMEEILDFLQRVRPVISEALTDKKQRYTFYYRLSELCMAENRGLTEEEFRRQLLWHVQLAKKNLQESKD